ncbi:hypothetical protein C6W92_17095 [Roseovarius sp. A46]|nr:hypothetical protein C6W92_17095 [Roseovarius sp. A46]
MGPQYPDRAGQRGRPRHDLSTAAEGLRGQPARGRRRRLGLRGVPRSSRRPQPRAAHGYGPLVGRELRRRRCRDRQYHRTLRPACEEMGPAAPQTQAYDLRDARDHGLRRMVTSFLVSDGETLETIGRLLGHTQAQTTARYAHLMDDPQKRAVDRAGKIVSGEG